MAADVTTAANSYTDTKIEQIRTSINTINNTITAIRSDMPTDESIQDKIDIKLSNLGYVTKNEMTDVLNNNFVKKSDISGIISGDFVSTDTFNNTLLDYAKKSDIEGLIPGDYVTKDELNDFHVTVLEEVDEKIINFEAVRAMTQTDINNAIESVLH